VTLQLRYVISAEVHAFGPDAVVVPQISDGEPPVSAIKIAAQAATTASLVISVAQIEVQAKPRFGNVATSAGATSLSHRY